MTPKEPATSNPHLAEGVALFNEGKYWHAHEAWERDWLVATGDEKLFLQGLIQLAAGYHHVRRGTFKGALSLLGKALTKLEKFPDHYLGVDCAATVARAAEHRERIAGGEHIGAGDVPNIRYN
jgi:predicted metal-dependent hydrolase